MGVGIDCIGVMGQQALEGKKSGGYWAYGYMAEGGIFKHGVTVYEYGFICLLGFSVIFFISSMVFTLIKSMTCFPSNLDVHPELPALVELPAVLDIPLWKPQ